VTSTAGGMAPKLASVSVARIALELARIMRYASSSTGDRVPSRSRTSGAVSVLITPGWNSMVCVASTRSSGSYSLKATATAPVSPRSLALRNRPRSASPGSDARSTARSPMATSQRDRFASASSARLRSVMSRTMCTAPTITPSSSMGSAVIWYQFPPKVSSKLSRRPVRSISRYGHFSKNVREPCMSS